MKYLLWLFLPVLVFSQVRTVTQTGIKKTMIRGDLTTLTWTTPSDYSADSLRFVVKSCPDDSCGRLIEKNTGGNGLTAAYASNKTTISATINTVNTQGFTAATYYYDIFNETDSVTLITGILVIQEDVSTPADGVATSYPYYTIALDFPASDTTFMMGYNADSTWGQASIDEVRAVLSSTAATVPDSVVYPYETNSWDKDTTNDVTTNTTQTISGQKTFSNTKTVFSGDSVGIRGDLDVDGNLYSVFDNYGINNNVDSKSITIGDNDMHVETDLEPYISIVGTDSSISIHNRVLDTYSNIAELEAEDYIKLTAPNYIKLETDSVNITGDLKVNGDILGYLKTSDSTIYATQSDIAGLTGDTTHYVSFNKILGRPDTTGVTSGYVWKYVNGSFTWGADATGSGGAAYSDSVTHDGRHVVGDSLITDAEGYARFLELSDSTIYLTPSDASVAYQPLDADLTDLADGSLTFSKVAGLQDSMNIANAYVDSNYVLTSETSAWDKTSSDDLLKSDSTTYLTPSDARDEFLQISDSTIYATQYDISGLTGDTTHFTTIAKVIGLQDSLNKFLELSNLPDSIVYTSEISGDTSDYSVTQMDSLLGLAGTSLQISDTVSTLATIYDVSQAGGTPDSSYYLTVYDAAQQYLELSDSTIYATQYDISQLGASDTSHYSLWSWVLGADDSVGNAISDSLDNYWLNPTLQPSFILGSGGTWAVYSKAAFVDSLDIGAADTVHYHPISKVINLQDSLNTFLHLGDSTLYATQYDLTQVGGSPDSTIYLTTWDASQQYLEISDSTIYLTPNDAAVAYQPLDADLTDLADGSLTFSKVAGLQDSMDVANAYVDSNYVLTSEMDLAPGLIQDSLTVKLNRSEMDLAPSLIQDSLTVKLNRSEYSAGSGDMTKAVYDVNNNLTVDDADSLGGVVATGYVTKTALADSSFLVWGDTTATIASKVTVRDSLAKYWLAPAAIGSMPYSSDGTSWAVVTSDLSPALIQDSLTVKLNRSEMDLAPSLIQDSLTVKLNRSEMEIAPSLLQDSLNTKGWKAGQAWTGTHDFGGATLEIPNSAADQTLGVAGEVGINTTDEQLSFHSAADGEVSGEVSIPILQTYSITFDPKAVCDGTIDALYMFKVDARQHPEGITIDGWEVSFSQNPATELDADLSRASAIIGQTGEADIDALDTTDGAASEDTDANINGGAVVAAGQYIYIEFVTAYTAAGEQITFQMWYHSEED